MVNPKLQYNYTNHNYIPESYMLLAYSVVIDGEFLWNGENILANHISVVHT